MRLNQYLVFIVMCIASACIPLIAQPNRIANTADFPGWPTTFEGKSLTPLPLTGLEQKFAENFPGRIGRFSDGQREIIIRWVTHETRKLHPAADCFRGSGYEVQPLPMKLTKAGERWGHFRAKRQAISMLVDERIFNQQGQQWTDVSAWYWSAAWSQSIGPWWAVTIAQKQSIL
jgi:hypothetical protein